MLILDPKMPSFSHFRHNKNFSLKSKTFTYIYSCLSSGTILEKSTNRVRENIKHVKFGPKIAHLTHFWHNKSFHQKLPKTSLHAKYQKNEQSGNLEKTMSQTDG